MQSGSAGACAGARACSSKRSQVGELQGRRCMSSTSACAWCAHGAQGTVGQGRAEKPRPLLERGRSTNIRELLSLPPQRNMCDDIIVVGIHRDLLVAEPSAATHDNDMV